MGDSLVVVYTGARGSGKTLSMAFDISLALRNNVPVWSNIPVSFYWSPDDDTPAKFYQSLPLNMELLYTLDRGVSDGIVAIDEINLWADSWSTQNVAARLLTAVFQQIRKRSLSFYLTTQNFNWINTRIRWQTDLHIACSDISYKYHEMERGAFIHQKLFDMSGIFSGDPFRDDNWNNNNVKERLGFLKPYWKAYNTLNEFDYESVTTKYKVEHETKVIRDGQVFASESNQEVAGKINFMAGVLRGEGIKTISIPEMENYLKSFGVSTDLTHAGWYLKGMGFEYKRSRKGNFYQVNDIPDYENLDEYSPDSKKYSFKEPENT